MTALMLRPRRSDLVHSTTAARNRVSLRETGLIPIPQLPPPTTKLCESAHGFASDTQSRAVGGPSIDTALRYGYGTNCSGEKERRDD